MADVENPIVEDHLEDLEDVEEDEPAPVPIPLQHILTAYVALLGNFSEKILIKFIFTFFVTILTI